MGMVGSRRAAGAPWLGMLVVGLFGLCAAGCSTAPQALGAAATVRGPTVAFESIDGPPESIFRKLVQDLNDEATARQMAVVSRDAPTQYRVRGYLAALVEKRRRTVIAWVWDVYDADQRRAMRITGEEPAGASGRGTWAAADDQLLRRIAKSGIERLAAFLAAPNTEPPAVPDERGPNIAAGDDVTPESARIIRVIAAATAAHAEDTAPISADGPKAPQDGVAAALAFSGDDRHWPVREKVPGQ
jgi:hypothetical protein